MTPVKFKRLWSEPSKQGVRQGRTRGKGKKMEGQLSRWVLQMKPTLSGDVTFLACGKQSQPWLSTQQNPALMGDMLVPRLSGRLQKHCGVRQTVEHTRCHTARMTTSIPQQLLYPGPCCCLHWQTTDTASDARSQVKQHLRTRTTCFFFWSPIDFLDHRPSQGGQSMQRGRISLPTKIHTAGNCPKQEEGHS